MRNLEQLSPGRILQTITLILNEPQLHTFSALARKENSLEGMTILGKGTVNHQLLKVFGMENQKMTVTKILVSKEEAEEVLDKLTEKMKLHRPNHGIAFTTAVSAIPLKDHRKGQLKEQAFATEEKRMYSKLTVIVNRGRASEVMDLAREAGARGGTILHGRGTGAKQAAKLFGIEIEPEKELVMMILPEDVVERVVEKLQKDLDLDHPGHGILFLEPVLDVRGLT